MDLTTRIDYLLPRLSRRAIRCVRTYVLYNAMKELTRKK